MAHLSLKMPKISFSSELAPSGTSTFPLGRATPSGLLSGKKKVLVSWERHIRDLCKFGTGKLKLLDKTSVQL